MTGRSWRLALSLLLVMVAPCWAQIAAGGRSSSPTSGEHAWAVTPSTLSSEWGLWHIPPRLGAGAAEDGAIRIVDSLERRPAGMSAYGGRVWLAFAGGGSQPGYAVLTAAVQRGAIEGTWFAGAGGRLGVAAFLGTRGRLVSMGAGPKGPVVLVEQTDGSLHVAWLERGDWRWAAGPDLASAADDGPKPSAIGVLDDGGLCLVGVSRERTLLWHAQLPEPVESTERFELIDPEALIDFQDDPAEDRQQIDDLDWSVATAAGASAAEASNVIAGPVSAGPRVLIAIDAEPGIRVYEIDGQRVGLLYETPPGGIALLGGDRRGVVVRLADEAQSVDGRAATRLALEEFSLDTGRRFFAGPAVFDGPISPSDLRILLVLMVLASASLLLFVVRSPRETKPFAPPPGHALAPPMPRLLAALADGFLALLLGGELARLLPDGWLAIRVGADAIDFAPLIVALALGYLACSLLESLTGRTPGKLIFGLAVSRSGLEDGKALPPRRPSLGASLARNGVKWLLPLVAIAGMASPFLRHRGDMISGLGVIGEIPVPTGQGTSSQDQRPDDR